MCLVRYMNMACDSAGCELGRFRRHARHGQHVPPLATVRPDFEQLGVAAMRETLFLLGEGDENSFASSQHGVGLIPAKVIGRTSLGTASRR